MRAPLTWGNAWMITNRDSSTWYDWALALPAPKVAANPHTNDAISTKARQRRVWRIGPIQWNYSIGGTWRRLIRHASQ